MTLQHLYYTKVYTASEKSWDVTHYIPAEANYLYHTVASPQNFWLQEFITCVEVPLR